jgi:hypothetical protein
MERFAAEVMPHLRGPETSDSFKRPPGRRP